MSDKFILFNDEKVDPKQLMMLTDLARLILEDGDVKVNYRKFGYYDPVDNELNVSFKWRHRGQNDELTALKSDCLLYGYSYQYTDYRAVRAVLDEEIQYHQFCYQLLQLFEEYRLIQRITLQRPAAKKYFTRRRKLMQSDNESQLTVYQTKKMPTDLLFLQLEQVVLTENTLNIETGFGHEMDQLLADRMNYLFELKSTEDSIDLMWQIYYLVERYLERDMLNTYYYIPVSLIDDLARFKEEKSTAMAGNDESHQSTESEDVQMKHRNTKSSGSYMETEVSEGANSCAQSASGRAGDSSDETTEILAGRQRSHAQKDGDGADMSDKLGQENLNVNIIWREPKFSAVDEAAYQMIQSEINPEVKKLTSVIQKTMDHRYDDRRSQLVKGRLDRRLTNWFLDEQKRVFYKEDQQAKRLDATFTLLVDASYSMEDKLEETKKGIALFHETLQQLLVRHEVIAFNEDTFNADHLKQDNIFDYLIKYQDSLHHSGSSIAGLKSQDDNRDGLAIRVAGEMLLKRSETQKFLIIFSDGEPSAFEYEKNGIVDTHEAVMYLRRKGIYIINIFLSQHKIEEAMMTTVKNIYNEYCVFIEGVQNLPQIIGPLLKRLLLQSMK